MAHLLDTGILLRFVNKSDREHPVVHSAIGALVAGGQSMFAATQNIAEFYNVATRPLANNGLALPPKDVVESIEQDIEPICAVLAKTDAVFLEIKRLIGRYSVIGKQVHDARLVAMMLVWKVESILTLNDRDFRRYEPEGIAVVTPESIITGDAE